MMIWQRKYFLCPTDEQRKRAKYSIFSLLWLLSFFVVIRLLAFVTFLVDLDYSEVDLTRLGYFICTQTIQAVLLVYLIYLIYYKTHRASLLFLGLMSLNGLWQFGDMITLVTSSIILGLVCFSFYKLFLVQNILVPIDGEQPIASEDPTPNNSTH